MESDRRTSVKDRELYSSGGRGYVSGVAPAEVGPWREPRCNQAQAGQSKAGI